MTVTYNPALDVKAFGGKWDEEKHPRDSKGRFIETGAEVKIWGGALAKVIGNIGGGRIEVERENDGQRVIVHRNYLTVVRNADGSAPTNDVHKIGPIAKAEASANAQEMPNPQVPHGNVTGHAEELAGSIEGHNRRHAKNIRTAAHDYHQAVMTGTPSEQADRRADLLDAVDKAEADHGDKIGVPGSAANVRHAATGEYHEPGGAPAASPAPHAPAPSSQRLVDTPKPGEQRTVNGETVTVGDHAKGGSHEGEVVGFTPAGGVILRDENGNDWPYKPEAQLHITPAGERKPTAPDGGAPARPAPSGGAPDAPNVPDGGAPERPGAPSDGAAAGADSGTPSLPDTFAAAYAALAAAQTPEARKDAVKAIHRMAVNERSGRMQDVLPDAGAHALGDLLAAAGDDDSGQWDSAVSAMREALQGDKVPARWKALGDTLDKVGRPSGAPSGGAPSVTRDNATASIENLRAWYASPDFPARTDKNREYMAKLADDPTLTLSASHNLAMNKLGTSWDFRDARSGLTFGSSFTSEWGGQRQAQNLLAKYDAALTDFPWDSPNIGQEVRDWRNSDGESLADVLLRVKGQHDLDGGKSTFTSIAWQKRMQDPNRPPAPDGQSYGDEVKVGDVLSIKGTNGRPVDRSVTAAAEVSPGIYQYNLDDGQTVVANRNDTVPHGKPLDVLDANGNKIGERVLTSEIKPGDRIEQNPASYETLRRFRYLGLGGFSQADVANRQLDERQRQFAVRGTVAEELPEIGGGKFGNTRLDNMEFSTDGGKTWQPLPRANSSTVTEYDNMRADLTTLDGDRTIRLDPTPSTPDAGGDTPDVPGDGFTADTGPLDNAYGTVRVDHFGQGTRDYTGYLSRDSSGNVTLNDSNGEEITSFPNSRIIGIRQETAPDAGGDQPDVPGGGAPDGGADDPGDEPLPPPVLPGDPDAGETPEERLARLKDEQRGQAGLDARWDVTGSGLFVSRLNQLRPGDVIYTKGDGSAADPVDLPRVSPGSGLPGYGKRQRTIARIEKNPDGSGWTVHFTDGTSTGEEGGSAVGSPFPAVTRVYAVPRSARPDPDVRPPEPDPKVLPPEPDKPTSIEPTTARSLTVGDQFIASDGNPVTIEGISHSGDRVSFDVIDGDGNRSTIDSDRSEELQRVTNGAKDPMPEPEDNPVNELGDAQVYAKDMQPGDKVWIGTQKAEIVGVQPNDEHTSLVTVKWPDRSTETFPFGQQVVIDRAEDANLPDPSPLPDGTATARPALYTYQRRNIVALGWDQHQDPMVAEAARRIRLRQPLAAAHASALSQALVNASNESGVKPQRQRMLLRLAGAHNAAAIEAGGRGIELPEMPNGRTVTRANIGDLGVGDHMVFVGHDGQPVQGRISNIRRMMGGRLHEVTYTDPEGNERTVMLSKGTQVHLMPDLPDDKPVPEPASRELIPAGQLGIGDVVRIRTSDHPEGINVRVLSKGVDDEGDAYVELDHPDPYNGGNKRLDARNTLDPDTIRVARGDETADQPRNFDIPDWKETQVPVGEIKEGDWVRVPQRFGGDIEGIVTGRASITGPDGGVAGQRLVVRSITGGVGTAVTHMTEDGPITRLADNDHNTIARLAEVKKLRDQHREVMVVASDIAGVLNKVNTSMLTHDLRQAINFGQLTDQSALDDRIHLAIVQWRNSYPFKSYRDDLAARLAMRLTGEGKGHNANTAALGRAEELANQIILDHLDRHEQAVIGAQPTQPGMSRGVAMSEMIRMIDGGEVSVESRDLMAIGQSILAARQALQGTEAPTGSQGLSEVPDLPEGTDLGTRIGEYRKALGGTFGHQQAQVSSFGKLDLDALERGEVPEVVSSTVTKRDLAMDKGPGEIAMRHLDIVKAAGKDMSAEMTREMERLDPGVTAGLTPEEAKARTKAALQAGNDAEKAYNEHFRGLRDQLAQARGYKDFNDLVNMRHSYSAAPAAKEKASADMREVMTAVNEDPRTKELDKAKYDAKEAYSIAVRSQSGSEKRYKTARAQAARNILAKIRPMGGTKLDYQNPKTGKPLTERGELVQAMRFAESNYPTEWLDAAKARGAINLGSTTRGYYLAGGRKIMLSKDWGTKLDEAGPRGKVATHELGHEMERAVEGLYMAEWAQLWARTAEGEIGSRKRNRTGTTDKSATYADEFPESYTGKDYGRGDALEVFTTQVESLFAGSPYMDEDLQHWLLGVMALV